jgi:hypothetical protein
MPPSIGPATDETALVAAKDPNTRERTSSLATCEIIVTTEISPPLTATPI